MFLVLAGLLATVPQLPPVPGVRVDQRRHVITIVVGPFDVPSMPPGMEHAMHDEAPGTIAQELTWPVDGWFRGFKMEVFDARGTPLSRRLLHHFTLVNYDRRTLFFPVAERIASAALE